MAFPRTMRLRYRAGVRVAPVVPAGVVPRGATASVQPGATNPRAAALPRVSITARTSFGVEHFRGVSHAGISPAAGTTRFHSETAAFNTARVPALNLASSSPPSASTAGAMISAIRRLVVRSTAR